MRHFRKWVVLAMAAAVILGCGPAKELPDDGSGSKGTDRGPAEPKETIPTTSDPVAKEIVDRAIKAHTQNNPSLLKKAKVSKTSANGIMKLPVDGRMANPQTSRELIAAWPDRINVAYIHRTELNHTTRLVLRFPQFVWLGRDNRQDPIASPELMKEIMLRDTLAQHWLVLLFPFEQARTVVFDPRKGVGTPPTDTLRFFHPDRPVYSITFDSSTGYLVKVEYMQRDQSIPLLTEWMFSDFKSYSGFMLPTKISSARTTEKPKIRDVVEDWTVDSWEFPEKIDDATFDPPK